MKDFVKRNNQFIYAANEQVASLVGKIGPLAGLTDSYMAFLQHKRNRIDGWAVMWWAWMQLSRELRPQAREEAAGRQKVADVLNTFMADMEAIHDRFETKGAFINYDFWLNVESWTDELVSSGIDYTIPASGGPEMKQLRETLHQFWLSFLHLQPGERRGLNVASDQLRKRVHEIFDFH